MISRNKGIFSLEFLVPVIGFIFAVSTTHLWYHFVVTPHATEAVLKRKLAAAQGAGGGSAEMQARSLYVIIKDHEPMWEIIFCYWGMIVLGYKLVHVMRERRMFKYDFVRVQPGERIIPEDALDRYKELKTAIEREPRWRERLLPECILAALHRFHASASIQDSANAVRERAELAG